MRRWYGASPLHLVAVLACLALAGVAAAAARPERPGACGSALWFLGAVLVHDLVLFPLYALADRALPPAAAVNHLRVPALLSGLLLLLFWPVITQHSEGSYSFASGLDQDVYLGRWLVITAVLFLGSGAAVPASGAVAREGPAHRRGGVHRQRRRRRAARRRPRGRRARRAAGRRPPRRLARRTSTRGWSGCTPTCATASTSTGVDAVCHQAAVVGLGVDLQDLPHYVGVNELGTAVLLAAMDRARRAAAGAGQLDGRLRRGPLRVRRARRRPPRPARAGRPRRRPLRAALPLLRGRAGLGARAGGRPRSTRAASTPRPRPPRSTSASAWARGTGGSVVALRYHNVYGPRMPKDTPYAGVASLWRSALARGEAPRVFEDGQQQRDFVHVRDVARANLLALEATGPSGLTAYNVASGRPAGIGEVAAVLAARGRRAGAGRHRGVPPRRRPPRRRVARAGPARAGVHRGRRAARRGCASSRPPRCAAESPGP